MKPVNIDHIDQRAERAAGRTIGGWLLVLSRLLILWQPILVGLITAQALDVLAVRGRTVVLIILARALATAFGVAAGLALRGRQAGAVRLAKLSLLLSAGIEMLVYATPSFPSNRGPGETPLWVLGTLAYYSSWFVYLIRSKRVQATFGG